MNDGYLSKDRTRINQGQRQRRARHPRIDYCPSPEALAVIDARRERYYPLNTNSAVIDALVTGWASLAGIKCCKVQSPKSPETAPGILRQYAQARPPAYDFDKSPEVVQALARLHARQQAAKDAAKARQAAHDAERAKRLAALKAKERVTCGAKTPSGNPCRGQSLPGKRRCKWHGGCSTGPRTVEGKAKALANLRQNRRSDG